MSGVATQKASIAYQPQGGEDAMQIVGQGGNVLAWIDANGRPQGNMFSSQAFPAQAAKTAVTTAVSLFGTAPSIQGGLLNSLNKVCSIWAAGVFTSSVTAQQLTFSIVLGGVTVWSVQGTSQAVAITNGQFELEVVLTTASVGASGTVEAHGAVGIQQAAALGTSLPYFADQNTAPSSAINLPSSPLTLDIQIADTVSLTSITLRQALIEIYN